MSPLLSHLCKVCLERILSLSPSGCGGGERSDQLSAQPAHLNFPSSEVMPTKADRDQYELLCKDNTRRPVDEFEQCYLARVPSLVVVARSVAGKEDSIQELLRVAQVPTSAILCSSCSLVLRCVCGVCGSPQSGHTDTRHLCAFRIQRAMPSPTIYLQCVYSINTVEAIKTM